MLIKDELSEELFYLLFTFMPLRLKGKYVEKANVILRFI